MSVLEGVPAPQGWSWGKHRSPAPAPPTGHPCSLRAASAASPDQPRSGKRASSPGQGSLGRTRTPLGPLSTCLVRCAWCSYPQLLRPPGEQGSVLRGGRRQGGRREAGSEICSHSPDASPLSSTDPARVKAKIHRTSNWSHSWVPAENRIPASFPQRRAALPSLTAQVQS